LPLKPPPAQAREFQETSSDCSRVESSAVRDG
jgi:hypothetical protein